MLKKTDRPVRFLLSRLLWALRLSALFTIDRGLYKMRFFPTGVSANAWVSPKALKAEERFCSAYLVKGDVVVDVGANVGTTTLTASAIVGDSGRVFSVEPHPGIFRYLRKNVELNGFTNVELYNVAAGESTGTVSFSDIRSDTKNRVMDGQKLQVPLETIDSLLPDNVKSIALMKVDVEGYERQVFLGASGTLQMTDCVFFESQNEQYDFYSYTSSDVFDILKSHGFRIYKMQRTGPKNLLAIRDMSKFLERIPKAEISEVGLQEGSSPQPL